MVQKDQNKRNNKLIQMKRAEVYYILDDMII